MQEAHYYPFGLRLGGLSYTAGTPNRWKYNGKELHDELGLGWYDYGFRWYDPAMARFVSVDPLAEQFPELTTYQYAGNTPIMAIDLDGLEPLIIIKGKIIADKIYEGAKNIAYGIISGVFAPFNMVSNMHAAGNAQDPTTKAEFESAAKENAKEVVVDLALAGVGNEVVSTMKGAAKTVAKGADEVVEAGTIVDDLGKSFDEISEGSDLIKDSQSLIKETTGNASEAFEGIVKREGGKIDMIVDRGNGVKTFTNEQGTTFTLRSSTDGRPTISRQVKNEQTVKIRFNEEP